MASMPGAGPDRRLLLERVAAGPVLIASAARRVAATESSAGTPPGEWTAREVAAHLVAVETIVFRPRLDQIADVDAEEPLWTWMEPGPNDAPSAPTLEGALELFAACRSETVALVTGLDDACWGRTGRHAVYGRLDLAGLLGVMVDHDDEHLESLEVRAGARPRL